VLGAGTMGPGIAAVFAASGFESCIYARRTEACEPARALAEEQRQLLWDHGLASHADSAITATDDLEQAVGDAGFVVEAISEDAGAKSTLFRQVEELVLPHVVLGSTTSGLNVEKWSAAARHPARFVVMHFWNPAHLVPLVEVMGGSATDPALLNRVEDLLRRIGKYPVRLNRYAPGFIGARLQQAVVREAIALLQAGVASAEDIDAATRLSFGARFPVLGPLETSDVGGLDVVAAIHRYLLGDLDCSTGPQDLLTDLVAGGDLGVKTGRGFYNWSTRDAADLARRRDDELIMRLKSLHESGQLSFG
jgi:3-hydroxybutyryl-CoA dehydrogenase